jgi:hypothetical protein
VLQAVVLASPPTSARQPKAGQQPKIAKAKTAEGRSALHCAVIIGKPITSAVRVATAWQRYENGVEVVHFAPCPWRAVALLSQSPQAV